MRRLAEETGSAAWLDGDIGQSFLGQPATLNLACVEKGRQGTPPVHGMFFVCHEDAARARLPLLTGLKRLQEEGSRMGAGPLVIDTTGFVDKAAGGLAMKEHKIELLRPDTVLALEHRRELEPVLAPLRKHPRIRVLDISPHAKARYKSREQRVRSRRKKLQGYFRHAEELDMAISRLPVYDLPFCGKHSLAGLLDEQGLCLSLGIVLEHQAGTLRIITLLADTEPLVAARTSSLRLDPSTGLTY